MSHDASTVPLLSHRVVEPTSASPPSMAPSSKQHRIWPLLLLLILVHLSNVLYTLPLNRVIELRLCEEHYARHNPPLVYPNGSIPEHLCKIDEVQRRLAWLQGIMETTLVVCGTCCCAGITTRLMCLIHFPDFLVTIPFSFVAERWGVRVVLLWNLVPRIGMSVWAIIVGKAFRIMFVGDHRAEIPSGRYSRFLPTQAIISGPFLAVLGGECVFQSTIFTLTSALAQEYVER
jgi:hypothetical protein